MFYIINIQKGDRNNMKDKAKVQIILTEEYINQIKEEVTPHWGELGWVTYKRTYARWIPEKQRTEDWEETVKRVVEGNINLDPRLKETPLNPDTVQELEDEAKKLYKLIYGLGALPSGRNLWISGTEYQQRNGDSLNNCWFIAVRPQEYGNSHIMSDYLSENEKAVSMPFSFMFDELMKGGGVGFSVVSENVKEIPQVNYKTDLVVVISKDSESYEESIKTGAVDREEWIAAHNSDEYVYYSIPDTREGWVMANALMIDSHFIKVSDKKYKNIVIDISQIRPKGARIRGFGGTASGPMPLIDMLFDINGILNEKVNGYLTSVDCTDIGNLIGKAVVAGNVRRSAELALGSRNDEAFVTMKQDKDKLYHHRWASNNSIAIDSEFTDYAPIVDSILHNGEPGVVNLELSRNYGRIIDGKQSGIDMSAEGTNPCGEITLSNGEPCNLFEAFPHIALQQGWDLEEVFALGTRYTKRVTFSNYDWEVSRKIIEKNRRIGISMSGIQDWFLNEFGNRVVIGFKEEKDPVTNKKVSVPIYDERIIERMEALYQAVVKADKEYSEKLGCNISVKRTTVKPSGTVSKLAGVSEGMHFHYAGYLIQRIRFQDSDPLLPALKECGYRMEPDIYTANTVCVEFPIKAAHADSEYFESAGTVSIAEQFATQAFLQTYWADNAISCTITFQENEVNQVAELLKQYRFAIKSTSLLPYYGGELKQAPKEPINEQIYEKRCTEISGDVAKTFMILNNISEHENLELVSQSDCASGVCPIR